MVSVACFAGSQSFGEVSTYNVFIILLVRFGLLSGHLLANNCPLGRPYVLIVFCLFVFLFPILVLRPGLAFNCSSFCSLLFYYSYTMIKRSELRTEP